MSLSKSRLQAELSQHFPGLQAQILIRLFDALQVDAAAVGAALNTVVAKLNADVGVTDTDYAGVTITEKGVDQP